MACFVPFDNRNLDVSFFVFRPKVVVVQELVDALIDFSVCTEESLGSVQSSIFRSIHGNLIIWYAAWMKRSCENKDSLISALLQMIANYISSKGVLVEYRFADAYAGESKEGFAVAKFYTGDIILINLATVSSTNDNGSDEDDDDDGDDRIDDASYANLAIFRDRFLKMEGAVSGVCLKFQNNMATRTATTTTTTTVSSLYVWRSLQHCYSWVLNSDYRNKTMPFLARFKLAFKYDIFRVVYVSTDNAFKPLLVDRVLKKERAITGGGRSINSQIV